MARKKIAIGALSICLPVVCFSQAQKTFASADAVAEALIAAVQNDDLPGLAAMFGPAAHGILTSGDSNSDKEERAEFARLAAARHQLEPDPMNRKRMILSIGEEDWPFPVPIVLSDGRWHFDASTSAFEMHARRIGANELDAIETCSGYVEAQQEYAASDREKDGVLKYARRIDTLPPLVPRAFAEGSPEGKTAKPYHGYYFRVLTAQGPDAHGGRHNYLVKDSMIGGFGLVAWPAEYGVTGIHTFIVNQDGVVYEKDLGKPPVSSGPPVTVFNPDRSWKAVD